MSIPHHRSATPDPFIPHPENLVLPDGSVSERAAELLAELVSHNPETSEGAESQRNQRLGADKAFHLRRERRQHLPWWKRPSPWWLIGITPLSSIAMSAALAPRVEIYTLLACSVHKPEIFGRGIPRHVGGALNCSLELVLPPLNICASGDEISGLRFNNADWHPDGLPQGAIKQALDESTSKCASDPVVQAEVAKLTVVMSTLMGILGCLTTAWWGSFSDRKGRTRVLGIAVFGLLFTDFNFIFTTLNFRRLPGGYWFLLFGPLVEGILGGFGATTAASHAYIADMTTEAARSRMFSLSLGLMFSGLAFGPSLGSLLIRSTGNPLSVFYATSSLHLCYAFAVWFIVPESLLVEQMQQSQIEYDEDFRHNLQVPFGSSTCKAKLVVKAKRLFAFLSPLAIFSPEVDVGMNPLKKRRDWSLTWIAVAYGLSVSMVGSYSYMFQYAAATFGWNSETLGYWISLVGTARAIFLSVILPVAIKFLKPQPRTISETQPIATLLDGERQPLLTHDALPQRRLGSPASEPVKSPHGKEMHSIAFDMALARCSLFADMISHTLMALVPTSLAFTSASLMGSFGAGFSPAAQSVALAMYTRRGGTESGKLFGALSVVQALCSQIMGPTIYGLVYMKTVSTFPRMVFFVMVITSVLSFVFLTFVRVPEEKTGVDVSERQDVEIGPRGTVSEDATVTE